MTVVNLSIDVPLLDEGVSYYSMVFGLEETARPFSGLAILQAENATLCIHQKAEGSLPIPQPGQARHYARHWTAVHADFHVDDFEECLARVVRGGGRLEQLHQATGPMAVAFCSDPFGNGFCVLGSAA